MRKIDPAGVRSDFAHGLTDVRNFYTTAWLAITGDRDRTYLVESAFLSVAVLWEGYVSDLFLAYINRDSTRFAVHLRDAVNANISAKTRRIVDDYSIFSFPDHFTKENIIKLLDPRGGNVTFRNYTDLREGAQKYLVEEHRKGILDLPTKDQGTIDALIAVRNHIAHRSRQSYETMNQALNAGSLSEVGLRRGVNDVRQVGPWLKARPTPAQATRIEIFFDRVSAIGASI